MAGAESELAGTNLNKFSLLQKHELRKIPLDNPQLDPTLSIRTAKYTRAMMQFKQATMSDDQKRVSVELK
jgi:hypothetical protein